MGILYENIDDYHNAIKYYTKAIDKGNITAVNNLGSVYFKLKDYYMAEKYFTSAVHLNNCSAMYNLAFLYHVLFKAKKSINYMKLAEKYYLMAIKNNDTCAIYKLGCLYNSIKKYIISRKYFLMTIHVCSNISMYDLLNTTNSYSIDTLKQYAKSVIHDL